MRSKDSSAAAAWAVFALWANFATDARATATVPPSDPKAEVPRMRFESSFKDYRKLEDRPLASWKQANELVYRLGGWKAFASGNVPDVAPAPATTAPPPADPGHAGHKTR
jgi:hypothetical protein